MSKSIAFFDFDGTITRKDSFLSFIKFYKGPFRFYFGLMLLFPILIFYKVGLLANWRAKEIVIWYFFKGVSVTDFLKKGEEFSFKQIPYLVYREALERIKWHHNRQHRVVIVTASIDWWLEKWCEKLNIQLIATSLEQQNGKITGRLATKNCFGPEKVRRIQEKFDLYEFERIYAYGDSRSDQPMLSLAHEKYWKLFKN